MLALPPQSKGKKKDGLPRCSWSDHNTGIFIKLCVEQVKAGNRPGTFLTRSAWKEILDKCHSATGTNYDRLKLKNRWDTLKKDWRLWNALLRNETGLGRNVVTGAIEADEKWWADKLKRHPEAIKFRYAPLQHADELEIMYSDITSTGEWSYSPSSGQMPSFEEECEELDDDGDGEGEGEGVGASAGDDVGVGVGVGDDGLTPDDDVEMHPSDLTAKRPRNGNSGQGSKKKKTNSNGHVRTLNRLVDVAEASSASSIQSKIGGHSIAECLDKLGKIDGVSEEDDHYVWAARMFLRDKHREMFMTLKSDELRLRWLNLEIALEKSQIPGYRE